MALVARAIDADIAPWLLASHCSQETGHALALQALGLSPLLDLGFRLGDELARTQVVDGKVVSGSGLLVAPSPPQPLGPARSAREWSSLFARKWIRRARRPLHLHLR